LIATQKTSISQTEGLYVNCPPNRKEEELIEETMAKFTADVNELDMHKSVQLQAEKNLAHFDGYFVIRDAFIEGRNACAPDLRVMWWITQNDQHWFKSDLLIDCIQTLKPFNCWFKFCSQNYFDIPNKQEVEKRLSMEKERAEHDTEEKTGKEKILTMEKQIQKLR